MAGIAVGAPKQPKSDVVGYLFTLPITETPPADGFTALPSGAVDAGYVGEDGVTLTAEIDAEMVKDWNLDDVLQMKNGASASIEIPVFGFSEDQAKIIYGDDSVIKTANGFKVVWAGELPPHMWLVAELRGSNGDARLVCDVQVNSPGEVQFVTNKPVTHTLSAALFKNSKLPDAKGRAGYFALYDEAAPTP